MNVRIDEDGNLVLMRRGEWKFQYCPFAQTDPGDDPLRCGNWCPHFDHGEDDQFLELCHGTVIKNSDVKKDDIIKTPSETTQ